MTDLEIRKKNMKETNIKLDVLDRTGQVVKKLDVPVDVFNGEVNEVLLYEANKMYQARKRRGTASTKTRSDVSGGGAKPWRQKGTGRARFGSSRNPIWRHGGVAFGPKPRDYKYKMPKKALRKALLSGLNARLKEDKVKMVDELEVDRPKTKEFKKILRNLEIDGKVLVVVSKFSENIKRASRNLSHVTMKEARNINSQDVLLNEYIVLEQKAFSMIIERVK